MSANKLPHTFIDFVKITEQPCKRNGWYVIVTDAKSNRYYVSKLFGAAAQGLKVGTKMRLNRSTAKAFLAYSLERV